MLLTDPSTTAYRGGPRVYAAELLGALSADPRLELANPRAAVPGAPKWRQALSILRDVAFNNPDIVHVATPGLQLILSILLKPFGHFSLVVTCHSLAKVSPTLRARLHVTATLWEWMMANWADCVVVPSFRLLRDASECGYRLKRGRVIYHGVPERLLSVPPKAGICRGRFVVAGGFYEEKGAARFALLDQWLDPSYELTWIGYDPADPEQRKAMALYGHSLSPRATIERAVPPEHIGAALDAFDILVVPSYYESFCMAVLAAACRGIPSVVSCNTGAADLLQQYGAGEVVDFDSEAAVQRGVAAVSSDYKRYSINAYAMARANTWAAASQKYVALYLSLGRLARKGKWKSSDVCQSDL